MFFDIGLYKRNDHIGTFHHAATVDNNFRIVGMNQPRRAGGPDMQTAIAQRSRYLVSLLGVAKEFFKVYRLILAEGAVGVPGPVARHQRDGPARRLGLGTSDVSTGASSAVEKHGKVAAQAASLRVFATDQRPPNHGRSTDAGSERGHDHVVKAASRAGIAFAEECHTCVILNSQWNAKFLLRPCHEIDADGVIVFLIGGDDAADTSIGQSTKTER